MTPHPYNVTILFLDYDVIIFDDVNPLRYCDVTVSLCPCCRTGVFLLLLCLAMPFSARALKKKTFSLTLILW